MSGFSNTPRGYVFYATENKENSFTKELHVTLCGLCTKFFPALLKAIFSGQQRGLGPERVPYQILSVEKVLGDGRTLPLNVDTQGFVQEPDPSSLSDWVTHVKPDSSYKIKLITPLRLRRNGKYLDTFDLSFFLTSVARRLETLNYFFNGGSPLGKGTWKALTAYFARAECFEANTRWVELSRYSNRQRRRVPLGGILGEVIIRDGEFRSWVEAASLVHVGKGTAMGLGKVEIIQTGKEQSNE